MVTLTLGLALPPRKSTSLFLPDQKRLISMACIWAKYVLYTVPSWRRTEFTQRAGQIYNDRGMEYVKAERKSRWSKIMVIECGV